MVKFKLYILAVLLITFVTGCASTTNRYMEIVKPGKDYKPEPGKALLVFQREDTILAGAYSGYIWDVTDKQNPDIIGYLDIGMKTAYSVPPGDYIFMSAFTGTANMMKASVAAGKTYFVHVEMTFTKGLDFDPIKANERNWMTTEDIAEPVPKIKAWARKTENINSALKSLGKAQINWNELSPKEKAEHSLVPEDGR